MRETLHLKIALEIDEVTDYRAVVAQAIKANEQAFRPLMERLLEGEDESTVVINGSLDVQVVTVEDRRGSARVTFAAEFFAACRDLRSTSRHDATLPFVLTAECLVFALELPARWTTAL